MKFLFDLDGTLTTEETLSVISRHFSIGRDMETLTMETIRGTIPFEESFLHRVRILGNLPVSEISDLLSKVSLYPLLVDFIRNNVDNCAIVTGNLDCWSEKLGNRIGCAGFYSEAEVRDNAVACVKSILNKKAVVERYKSLGETVVFIGDGNNDADAMRHADISIAAGMTHSPAASLIPIATHVVYEEKKLYNILQRLSGT